MIIAGPCLFNEGDNHDVIQTAERLAGHIDYFRVKVWGGGTSPEKYYRGVGEEGLRELSCKINIPFGTEVQTPEHVEIARKYCTFIWIGARNSQNYGLLESLINFPGPIFIKRGSGMTIDELYGVYDVMRGVFKKEVWLIERGINTFDRLLVSRWSPDIKGAIRIKLERPDIFARYIVDCSHSVGIKSYVQDVYTAFKSIGVKHFMFECTHNGMSKTDSNHMLSVDEFLNIKG